MVNHVKDQVMQYQLLFDYLIELNINYLNLIDYYY